MTKENRMTNGEHLSAALVPATASRGEGGDCEADGGKSTLEIVRPHSALWEREKIACAHGFGERIEPGSAAGLSAAIENLGLEISEGNPPHYFGSYAEGKGVPAGRPYHGAEDAVTIGELRLFWQIADSGLKNGAKNWRDFAAFCAFSRVFWKYFFRRLSRLVRFAFLRPRTVGLQNKQEQ